MKRYRPDKKMQKSPKKERILFFDIIRIFAIIIITWMHSLYNLYPNNLLPEVQGILFRNGSYLFGLYPANWGFLSVYFLIFVSGAVLEYNHPKIEKLSEYKDFIYKRFIRLFPAYWITLIAGVIIVPQFLMLPISNLILQISGLITFTQQEFGCLECNIINPMVWFVVTIFLLYLLFPFISKLMEKHAFYWVIAFFIIGYCSAYIIVNTYIFSWYPGFALARVFPLCNIFEFSLGIYVIKRGLYPKNTRSYHLIGKIADFTFYVFLCQFIFYVVYIDRMQQLFGSLGNNLAVIVGVVILVSFLIMQADQYIQKIIKKKGIE